MLYLLGLRSRLRHRPDFEGEKYYTAHYNNMVRLLSQLSGLPQIMFLYIVLVASLVKVPLLLRYFLAFSG